MFPSVMVLRCKVALFQTLNTAGLLFLQVLGTQSGVVGAQVKPLPVEVLWKYFSVLTWPVIPVESRSSSSPAWIVSFFCKPIFALDSPELACNRKLPIPTLLASVSTIIFSPGPGYSGTGAMQSDSFRD